MEPVEILITVPATVLTSTPLIVVVGLGYLLYMLW